jgi:ribose-phosphate pyrophosphokinase
VTAFSAFGGREAAGLYADQFEIYHGNSNPGLARKICRYLGTEPGKLEVFQFANENIFVKILENVREKDVFIVQPTSHPVNQSIMELLIMIDAFKRASAGRITAVIPFYAYGRSDKKDQPRVPSRPGHRRHDHCRRRGPRPDDGPSPGQIQGFFNIGRRVDRRPHALTTTATRTSRTRSSSPTSASPNAPAFAELLDASGHHREAAPRQPRSGGADERHRRRQGQARDHRR